MVAVDTNILVYAHRADSPFHERARAVVESLASGVAPWAIPWPCVHEFLSVVTHARIYRTPTPSAAAFAQLRALQAIPHLAFISEPEDFLSRLEALVVPAKVTGGAVHDARIAAICLAHGIDELWSADRDFSRFPSLATRNPLLD